MHEDAGRKPMRSSDRPKSPPSERGRALVSQIRWHRSDPPGSAVSEPGPPSAPLYRILAASAFMMAEFFQACCAKSLGRAAQASLNLAASRILALLLVIFPKL